MSSRSKKGSETPGMMNPLDEVRLAEARAASQVVLAQQAAEELRQATAGQASQIKERARETGAREGQARYDEMVREAGLEAQRLTAEAQARADALRKAGRRQIARAAGWAVKVVLGLEWEKREP